MKIDGRDVGWFAFDTGSGAGFTLLASFADELGMPRFGKLSGGGAGAAIQVAALADPQTLGTLEGILMAPKKLLFDYARRLMAVIE